jgi:hypothetical protein
MLNHVAPLGFTVYKKVQADLFLEGDYGSDFLLDEVFVFSLCYLLS